MSKKPVICVESAVNGKGSYFKAILLTENGDISADGSTIDEAIGRLVRSNWVKLSLDKLQITQEVEELEVKIQDDETRLDVDFEAILADVMNIYNDNDYEAGWIVHQIADRVGLSKLTRQHWIKLAEEAGYNSGWGYHRYYEHHPKT